jgi:hypothetical protein
MAINASIYISPSELYNSVSFSYAVPTDEQYNNINLSIMEFDLFPNSCWFGTDGLNVLAATIDSTTDTYGNVGNNTQSLKDHLEYYIASQVFGSYSCRSLFNNIADFEQKVLDTVNAAFNYSNYRNGENITKQLFTAITTIDTGYWSNKTGGLVVDTYGYKGYEYWTCYGLEFTDGDEIYFDLEITPDANQSASAIPAITYRIWLRVVTPD